MYILGIESSCDETAVAIIERGDSNRLIAEQIKSQIPFHEKYGGIVPEIASRSHYEAIDYLTEQALSQAKLSITDIGLIALTIGPGLIGSLLVGLSFAKALSYSYRIPMVPVDHINAHIESVFIERAGIKYPLIALVVSGGHTSIFYQPAKFEIELVAKTRDDAVGEVMDKVAKFFDQGYPGGPVLDKKHVLGDKKGYKFTIPKMSDGSNDFSFSGYKTAVLRYARENSVIADSQQFYDLIASFLESVVSYLLQKTKNAVEKYGVGSVVVAGGVSRNSLLRKRFNKEFAGTGIKLVLPKARFCTDNATMVAWRGYEKFKFYPDKNYFDFNLNSYSRAGFKWGAKHK